MMSQVLARSSGGSISCIGMDSSGRCICFSFLLFLHKDETKSALMVTKMQLVTLFQFNNSVEWKSLKLSENRLCAYKGQKGIWIALFRPDNCAPCYALSACLDEGHCIGREMRSVTFGRLCELGDQLLFFCAKLMKVLGPCTHAN